MGQVIYMGYMIIWIYRIYIAIYIIYIFYIHITNKLLPPGPPPAPRCGK